MRLLYHSPFPCNILGPSWTGTCLLPKLMFRHTHAALSCLHTSDKSSLRDCITPYWTLSISDLRNLVTIACQTMGITQKNPQTFPKFLWKWTLLTVIEKHWQGPFLNTWLFLSKNCPGLCIYLFIEWCMFKFSINICKIKTVPSTFLSKLLLTLF